MGLSNAVIPQSFVLSSHLYSSYILHMGDFIKLAHVLQETSKRKSIELWNLDTV